jgi:hypothetical protein
MPSYYVKAFSKLVVLKLGRHGERETVRLLKELRVYVTREILSQERLHLPFTKVNRRGIPKILQPWENLIKGTIDEKRFVLSIFRLIDSFRCLPLEDLSTVTGKFSGDQRMISTLSKWIKTTKRPKINDQIGKGKLILSRKAGPNGPATITSIVDLGPLRESWELYSVVAKHVFKNTGLIIDTYESEPGGKTHSKIIFLSDKACKTRVIAIGDYWSNVALYRVHTIFMDVLSKMYGDFTYRQSDIPRVIKSLGTHLHTSDMTAFTDRLPSELCSVVVDHVCGHIMSGSDWLKIMVERRFSSNLPSSVYEVGNPMGFLSSWAVSTYTHHMIMRFAAYSCKQKRFSYMILGDDSLCNNATVYNVYRKVIIELGLTISLSKCTRSTHGYAEFAKRLFTPFGEVTGIPVDLIKGISHFPERLIELIKIMRNRGYSESLIDPGVQSLTKSWKNHKLISLILSAPEQFLGTPPLGADTADAHSIWGSGLPNDETIVQARKIIFWREVDKVIDAYQKGKALYSFKGREHHMHKDHPAFYAITEKLMTYFVKDDHWSVWRSWMNGERYELVEIPSVEVYRYTRRTNYTTKCKFDIIKTAIAIKSGRILDVSLSSRKPISDYDLFMLSFPSGSGSLRLL